MPLFDAKQNVVWQNFEALSQIPRGSGQEAAAARFVRDFAQQHGLASEQDVAGNVLVRKPATPGYEHRPQIALQAHLDMVQVAEPGHQIDFSNDGIVLQRDGDWLTANGTTLGADNGIGVSLILSVLQSTSMSHPSIEALFTVDEEVNMSGAEAVSSDWLQAEMLINLDEEADTGITIGCAGAVDIVASGSFDRNPLPAGMVPVHLLITGGLGGHSGADIHLGRSNAVILLAELLDLALTKLQATLLDVKANNPPNVIPTLGAASIAVPENKITQTEEVLHAAANELFSRFSRNEPDLSLTLSHGELADEFVIPNQFAQKIIRCVLATPNGIQSLIAGTDKQIESSNNLASLTVSQGHFECLSLFRTCVDSRKSGFTNLLSDIWRPVNATIHTEYDAPGWPLKQEGALLRAARYSFEKETQTAPEICTIHAGLECAVISQKFPDMEMISIGPNIENVHTPQERVQISSVDKISTILCTLLASIPAKAADELSGDLHENTV